jgi:predicted NBD/HSP70 family sugar kinase
MKLDTSQVIGGNAKVVRSINRSGILNIIRERQPISRIEISKITGLNKSTVSSIVNELFEENLIYEEMVQDQNVGRNPLQLRLKLGTHYVGALNLDSAVSRVAVVDIDGTILDKDKLDTRSENPEIFIKDCIDLLMSLIMKNKIENFIGIGVSVAGIVNVSRDVIVNAPNIGWKEFAVGNLVRKLVRNDKIIKFVNDAKSSALAELWFGTGEIKDIDDFVFVSVGIGIGTGIVVGKNLLDGHSYAAGEFGHMTMFTKGEYCACGNYGCLEAYASDRATVRRYNRLRKENDKKILLKDVIECARQGDAMAIQAIKETGYYLGLGISNIIKSVDPEAVVLGGRITQMWDIIYPEIIRAVDQHALFDYKREIKILCSSLSVRPRLLGAATVVLKEFFNDYKIVK